MLSLKRLNDHRLIWLSSALMLAIGLELGGFQLLLSDISQEFQTTKMGMGVVAAAQYVSIIVMPLVFGHVADKLGKRMVLIGGMTTAVLGCTVAAIAGSSGFFTAGVFLIGAGFSVCESVSAALLSDLYPGNNRRYISLCQFMLSLGAVLSPMILGFCVAHIVIGWRFLFIICAVMFLPLMFFLAKAKFPAPTAVEASDKRMIATFFKSPVFVMLFTTILLYVGLENGLGYFMKTLFDIRLSATGWGAYAISAYWAGMAISRMLNSLRKKHAEPMMGACLLSSCALFVVLILSRSAYLSFAACALIGVVFGPIWPTLIALAVKEFPRNSGEAIGVMSSGCGLGGMLFPVLVGALAEWVDIGWGFMLLAAAALLGFLLWRQALRIRR